MALPLEMFDEIWALTMEMLPAEMNTDAAKAEIIAIALQESRFQYRTQIGGPARGFWQFEKAGGVRGVLQHRSTRIPIREVLAKLKYQPDEQECYEAIAHNDILACAFARLLMWTVPDPLPAINQPDFGFYVYEKGWRPGKPIRHTWNKLFDQAWGHVRARPLEP